jgi:tetratricopeptide (TPR) repeat protein
MSLFRSRGFVVAAPMYAALSLVCTLVPLLNYLGYEFSALIGLAGSLISGPLTIRIVKPVYYAGDVSGETRSFQVATAFKQAVALNMIALVIPSVIMATNALFVKNCSLLQGMGFFLLIPVVSVWFGSALGFLCAVHYHFSKIVFNLYCLAFLIYSVALGYFTPAIFSYNFLYGYFPGLTYDEALGLSWTLVVFRLLTVFVGAILVWFAIILVRNSSPTDKSWAKGISLVKLLVDVRRRIVTGIVVAVLVMAWFFRGELGFESTSGFIQSRLGSTYTTEHFTICFSKDSYDDDEMKWIAAEHEFRLKQIADAFFVQFRGKIESFIYPSSEAKQRLIGTGTTNIAKPWSDQIHITKQSLDGTLKHELVHIVAGQFGLPIIKASLSTGLIEGLAMAIEWDWGNRTPHQYAAAMRKFGVMPDVEPLMLLTGFASQASSVSYVVCGSFCRFLIDRYGMRKMMQVYRTNDFNLTYGRALHQLTDEWRGFLGRVQVTDQDRDAIDVMFRRPPIFKKVCARVIAERNIEARKKYEAKEYNAAETLYGESYAEGRGYEALSGYLASALRSGNASVIPAALDSIILKGPHPTQYLPLFITIGDAHWALGNTQKAFELYMRVKQADLSAGLNESALLRSLAVEDTAVNTSLRSYFMSDANDTVRLEMVTNALTRSPHHWVLQYLKGRLLLRMQQYQESFDRLTSLTLAPEDSLLEALRLRMIGYGLFRLKKFEDAKSAFWSSLNYLSTEVAVNEVNDWVERCEWMENQELK